MHTRAQHAILLVKLHEQTSEEFDLAAEFFTIGRKVDNQLAIDDPVVSSHYARTSFHAVHFIEDLNSTNGTYSPQGEQRAGMRTDYCRSSRCPFGKD